MTTTIRIQGMHCASCKALIEDVCQEFPGVTSCTVDQTTGMATIEHDASVNLDALRQEIEQLGAYQTTVV